MTDADFEKCYTDFYGSLLRYALSKTDDFFLAEEAVNDAFLDLWNAKTDTWSYTVLKRNTSWRIIDLLRVKARVMAYIVVDGEVKKTASIEEQNEYTEDGFMNTISVSRPLEDVVMDIIDIKEAFHAYPGVIDAIFDPEMSTNNRHSRLYRGRRVASGLAPVPGRVKPIKHGTTYAYNHHKCRCAPCIETNRARMQKRHEKKAA